MWMAVCDSGEAVYALAVLGGCVRIIRVAGAWAGLAESWLAAFNLQVRGRPFRAGVFIGVPPSSDRWLDNLDGNLGALS